MIHILISTNDSYVMPLSVLLQSLFETQKEPMKFWFMCSELNQENRDYFSAYFRNNHAEAEYVEIPQTAFLGLPTKKYISRETYFRLLAAEYLPAGLDRILWLDADMIAHGDLSDFYHSDFEGMSVTACPHGPIMRPKMIENSREIGMRHPEQYFNAGVMLCNLDEWRRMDIPARISRELSVPRKLMFPGQDLTNLIFNGSVKTEDWRVYNCMAHSILPEELPELRKIARIIHFAGFAKPWNFSDLPFSDLWKEYYDRSPFSGKPLKRTSYRIMKSLYEKYRERVPDGMPDMDGFEA